MRGKKREGSDQEQAAPPEQEQIPNEGQNRGHEDGASVRTAEAIPRVGYPYDGRSRHKLHIPRKVKCPEESHDHQQGHKTQRYTGRDKLAVIAIQECREILNGMALDFFSVESLAVGVGGPSLLTQVVTALFAQNLALKGHGIRRGLHRAARRANEFLPNDRTSRRAGRCFQRSQTAQAGEVPKVVQQAPRAAYICEGVPQVALKTQAACQVQVDARRGTGGRLRTRFAGVGPWDTFWNRWGATFFAATQLGSPSSHTSVSGVILPCCASCPI